MVVREHLKGMSDADMNREFLLGSITKLGGDTPSLPLKEIIKRLNNIYCGHIGLEYVYIHDPMVVSIEVGGRIFVLFVATNESVSS